MALLPANRRDQVFALIGVVALVAAGVYYMYVWDPKKAELDASQARLDTLQVINQRAKSELAQGKTAQLKAEADKLAQDLAVMRQLVPTSNEVPALLEQVSTAARRVGLEIADVQPLPILAGDQYEAYKYRLSVRGGYNQIGQFLASVGSLQRIIAPINLTLAPLPFDAKVQRGARTQPLDARFEIETYVSRTVPVRAVKDTAAKPAGAAK